MDKKIVYGLVKILIAGALIMILIILLNLFYINNILSKKNFVRQEEAFEKYADNLSKKEINVLFFGTSLTLHGISPEFIPNSYNYATGAENNVKTYYKLKKAVEIKKIRVNNIVLPIDPETFSGAVVYHGHLLDELEVYSKFIPFEDIIEIRKEPPIDIWTEIEFPVLGKGKEFGILVKPLTRSDILLGWNKNSGNFSEINKTDALERYYSVFFSYPEMINNISFLYFIKTIEYSKRNNINVILITHPHTKESLDFLITKNISLDSYYFEIFKRINSTLGDEYIYLNYLELFNNDSSKFADLVHLRFTGAEELSKRINLDLGGINISGYDSKKTFSAKNLCASLPSLWG